MQSRHIRCSGSASVQKFQAHLIGSEDDAVHDERPRQRGSQALKEDAASLLTVALPLRSTRTRMLSATSRHPTQTKAGWQMTVGLIQRFSAICGTVDAQLNCSRVRILIVSMSGDDSGLKASLARGTVLRMTYEMLCTYNKWTHGLVTSCMQP